MEIEQTDIIRPDILTYDDIVRMSPSAKGHEKAVNLALRLWGIEQINAAHRRLCHCPGPECFHRFLSEYLNIRLRVDNEHILDNLPEGAFITVSNHPFGAVDGISLIHLITLRRPEFKVMVDRSLWQIPAMRPNFIAVDATASNDPDKKKISYSGIRKVIMQLQSGNPVGFFPAGEVSKTDWIYRLRDRQWQPSVMQIIHRACLPVIPVFFHGRNSLLFNLLSHTRWPSSTFLQPIEMWRKKGKEIHVSIGNPIMPDEIRAHHDSVSLGIFLRNATYSLGKKYR